MQKDRDFVRQLENFGHEARIVAHYVYAEMTIQHAASKSKILLNRLNDTPSFWLTCESALQTAAYIALGRVFDLRSPYNLNELVESIESDLTLFSKESLAQRKRESGFNNEERLAEYMVDTHQLTKSDVRSLERSIKNYRNIYDKAVMLVRHQYLAHRQAQEKSRVQALYAKGKLKELWRLSTYLICLHEALWNLFYNGRKPNLRLRRYSPKTMFDHPNQASSPSEYIVRDTQELMKFIETATALNSNRAIRKTHRSQSVD